MKEFCTYITFYRGDILPPFYIGSSYVDRIVNQGYHGSVTNKEWKTKYNSELKIHPGRFNTKILTYHDTREEALFRENTFQKQLNVVKNSLYMNKSSSNYNGFFGMDVSGDKNPNFGNTWSEEQRKKMSDRRKQEYIDDPDAFRMKLHLDRDRHGANNSNFGNTWSEEQKDRNRGSNNYFYGKSTAGDKNSMWGKHGQQHHRASIFVIKNTETNIVYEIYDRFKFYDLFKVNAYDIMQKALTPKPPGKSKSNGQPRKQMKKRTKWEWVEKLPRDPSKTSIYTIRFGNT
jgi:hypothetical protein